jgi:hypothetical protein
MIRGAVRVMSPPLVTTWPLDAGATLAEVLRIAVCPSEMLWVASIVMVGAAAAGAVTFGLATLTALDALVELPPLPGFPALPAFPAFVALVALVADEPAIFELFAAAPTGGPITMTAVGTLLDEVGTLL